MAPPPLNHTALLHLQFPILFILIDLDIGPWLGPHKATPLIFHHFPSPALFLSLYNYSHKIQCQARGSSPSQPHLHLPTTFSSTLDHSPSLYSFCNKVSIIPLWVFPCFPILLRRCLFLYLFVYLLILNISYSNTFFCILAIFLCWSSSEASTLSFSVCPCLILNYLIL